MTDLMQRVSALTIAAALAAAPAIATAQETTAPDAPAEGTEAPAGQAPETEAPAEGTTTTVTEPPADGTTTTVTEPPAEGTTGTTVTETPAEGADTVTETPAVPEGGQVPAEMGDEEVQPAEGTITMQDEDSILASELMGANLRNAGDENVGDVSDLIVSLDGTVEGVVIGVGGFLGIGQKSVAVEMQQLSVRMDEDGDPQLIIDATRESLEAAPEFVTAEEQRRDQEQQEMQSQQPAAGMGGTAPAGGGMAPADGGATAPAPAD